MATAPPRSARSPRRPRRCCARSARPGARCGPRRRDEARLGRRPASRWPSSSRPAGWTAIVEHNEGDFTAVLEAGVPLARGAGAVRRRRARCSRSTRRSARATRRRSAASWRPPTPARCATATAACATSWSASRVVLSDGTVAKSGGKVIKNVAGYDLGKLFTGSFGTLGLIVDGRRAAAPAARRDRHRVSARSDDPDVLAARRRARSPRCRSRPTASTSPGSDGAGRRARALRRRDRGRPGARSPRRACEAGLDGVEVDRGRRRTCGRASATRQRAADGAVLKVSGRADRPRRA